MAFMKLGSKPEAFRREGQTWSAFITYLIHHISHQHYVCFFCSCSYTKYNLESHLTLILFCFKGLYNRTSK